LQGGNHTAYVSKPALTLAVDEGAAGLRGERRSMRSLVPARLVELLAENSLLVVLVALLGTVLLAVAPQLLVPDSWMTLVAGREIASHGLPARETLTALPLGHRWTDQQWLAQIAFYGADRLGGLRLAVLLDVALVTATFGLGIAAARRRGASARSTLVVAVFAMLIAPWSWQLRAQALALPIFVAVVALAADDVSRPRRRTFATLALIALWANLHGSVLVGAGVVSLAGIAGLVRYLRHEDGAPRVVRSIALTVAPWLCILASPYALHLPGYYRLMLLDSPVSKVIVEWQAPKPHGWYLVFFGFAAATVALAVWQFRRLGWYNAAVLAATLAGSLRSGRGIVWFTLAALVLLPPALDGAFPGRDVPVRRRLGLALGSGFLLILAIAVATAAARRDSWFENEWPAGLPRAVAAAAASAPGEKAVFPSDLHGDYLLWKEPSLRGRVAYDVRFELLTSRQLTSLVRFKSDAADWASAADGYPVVVFDPDESEAHIRELGKAPGLRVLYQDTSVVVFRRATG
jgi:hypothetical protein